MHQPDYRGSDGVMKMPWVFLHAIKDYYEMPWLLSQHKGLKATFNITAPLIEQLNLYRDPLKNDYFLSLWAVHPSVLEDSDKQWLIKTCKSTQYETMVKPLPRFDQLYHQEFYTDEELIDFEVIFMLAWCGHYLRQGNSIVRELLLKSSGYTQSDKVLLLQTLCLFLQTILPFYEKLQDEGVISISTTPYSHPILPLLIDINNARLANIHTLLPDSPLSLKDDAMEQVRRAIELYHATFGRAPVGFWPAEGALDEASIEIYTQCGLRWIATDEALLFRSLGSENRVDLYKPYDYKGMTIGFRDHGLSDLIGFTYRFKTPHEATDHFIHALEAISNQADDPTVFVILDGENAWEFFHNNGYDFFTALYSRLETTPWCTTVTMDEVCALDTIGMLDRLSSGSWIHGTFDTWAGHPEKNRAWELIYQTKRDVANFTGVIAADVAQKIQLHFLASQCSDWFWWYGDDHVTQFSMEFDALFRGHLIEIYRLIGLGAPSYLFDPIVGQKNNTSFWVKPWESISPNIDGKNSSFFEWFGSGSIDESRMFSTMDRVRGPIDMIRYGHDTSSVYVAFEGDMRSFSHHDSMVQVTIEESGETFLFSPNVLDALSGTQCAMDERLEISLSRDCFKGYREIHLRFEIVQGDRIVQTMPGFGALLIELDETYAKNWFI